jgi:hypothetical protein
VPGNCGFCGSEIPLLDVEEDRAGVMSGKNCCAACLDNGAWFGSPTKPKGAEDRIWRGQPRFVPTLNLDLTLRLPGWRGVVHGNLAKQWLDVSGEGLRAVVGRQCAVGDLLMARISHRTTGKVYEIVSTVCNIQESDSTVVAGFLFANPSEEFQEMIRETYGIGDGRAKSPAKNTKKIG